MEGFFEEEVSSFLSGDGYFGVGDVSSDLAASWLRQRLLPSNSSSGNFYSNLLPIDINRWQGENILNSEYEVTENLSSLEQKSHGETDFLTGNNDATYVVENTLPMVQDFLQNFSSKADFKEQMNLAFGDSYDVNKANVLVDSWEDENLGFLPEIKVVFEDEINGAKGAFAGETETIYLAQEFLWENLGNVGAIAHLIVEEFGHYIDGEINSFDAPGDEGEIFVDLVRGVELSADELLGKQREDDWAIGFLDGEIVSIEQADRTQTDTLDFFAGEIQDWGSIPGGESRITLFDENIPEQPIEENVRNSFISYDFGTQSNLKAELFATTGNLGKAQFSYPILIDTQLPSQVSFDEQFTIIPGVNPSVNSASFANIGQGTEGFEIPNAGLNFSLDLGSAKLQNIEINNPFGDPIRLDGIDVGSRVGKAELNLDIASFLAGQISGDFLGGQISAQLPKINSLQPTDPSDNTGQLPSIAAMGKTDNVLNVAFDLDQIILSRVPVYLALQRSLRLTRSGIELNGLGFAINFPDATEEKARVEETRNRENQAREDLNTQLDVLRNIPSEAQLQEAERLRQITEQRRLESEAAQQELNISEDILKKQRNKIQLSGDILDIQANVGIGFQQEYSFIPEDVEVKFSVEEGSVDGGQESTKNLGETFNITAPSEGSGVMEVDAEYKLLGNVKNDIGLILQGSIDGKALELAGNITLAGANVFQEQLGPLVNVKIPSGGLASPPFTIIGSDPDPIPFLPSDPTLDVRQIETINTDEIGGEEDVTKNLIAEVTYYIPYGLPVSISDASVTEGETLEFVVTLTEPSDEPVSVSYRSEKGNGTVSFPPGETTQTIEIPTTDDRAIEETETFEITLNNPNGVSFPETLPNGESTITATGTIFDNDEKPDPDPPLPNPQEFNDPRYITIDGKSLEFQAAGEFTLIESLNDDYEIQIRQQPVGNDPLNNASDATAVATTIGGQRIGLYKDGQQLLIDGIPTTIPDNEYIPVGEGRIYREGNVYSFIYPKGDQLIATMTEDRINVSLFFSPERRDTVRGLFGTFNDNPDDDILKRDGTVLSEPISLEQLYGEYADSWRVSQAESLFDYQPGEDTSTFTIFNYPREKVQLSDLDPADVQRAIELIGDRLELIDPNLQDGVIIDLILTGFDETVIEQAVAAGVVSAGSVEILDELDELGAKDDFALTNANIPIEIDVLSNDTINPNTPLAIASFEQISTAGGAIALDDNDTPDDQSDDRLSYTPPENFTGADKFQYNIFNGTELTTAIVTINIPNLSLATLESNNGFVVNSTTPGNFNGIAVNKIGDINGDNIDDIAIGAFAADPEGNNAAGETYVIFGNNQPFPENIDPSTLNGSNGFILEGFVQTGFSGGAVSSAGDVNKDGINDMIIGAFGVTTNGQNNVGQAYVIFGSRDPFPPTIDIASLDGINGFALTGLYEFDYAGSAVGSAGDFNRDGIDDVFVSAPGPLNNQAGRTYVLFGNSSGFPPSQNLSQLNGTNGVIIDGLYTKSGGSVSSAGDVNQDGYDDLIIGADIGGTDSYVVYGGESLPATTLLSNLTNGFKIFGIDVVTDNGTNVSGVGDVNQDGIDDVIVSVTGTAPDGVSGVSKGYVIFGRTGGLPSDVDVKTLNGTNGFVITSANIDGISGMAVSGQGDFNKDGIADIILGKPNDNGNTGNSYVIFGSKESFPTNIDLASLNGTNGIAILGTETDDLTGVSVASAGDVNQDKVDDVIIGAPGNLFNDSPGKSYVVFGDGNFGNSVSLVFDEAYYLANNPEVNSAISSGLVRNGLDHFSQYGVDEQRDFRVFLFNEKYYLEQNPDIANLVAQGVYSNGLEHFTQLGQFEGRKPSPATTTTAEINFDEQYYLTQNPDVKSLVEQGILSSGFEHYIEVGQFQQRQTAG